MNSVVYSTGNNKFFAWATCATGNIDLVESVNGVTWSSLSSSANQILGPIDVHVSNDNKFLLAYGASAQKIGISTDAQNWTWHQDAQEIFGFAWNKSKFVGVGVDSSPSPKPLVWTSAGNAASNWTSEGITPSFNDVTAGGTKAAKRFVAVGNSTTPYYSDDGTTWTKGTCSTANCSQVESKAVAYNHVLGLYLSVGGGKILVSRDGKDWQYLYDDYHHTQAVEAVGRNFVGVGTDGVYTLDDNPQSSAK